MFIERINLRVFYCTLWGVIAFSAQGFEALQLPVNLPLLDKRGSWRETLEDLAIYGAPQSWLVLGPIKEAPGKFSDRQLEPERTDDWSRPLTDHLGRMFKSARWERPKDEGGFYVDVYDALNSPVEGQMAFARTEVVSPADGPGLLWFENAGTAVVYFNNENVASAAPKGVKHYDGQTVALFPIPILLKRGTNVLKVKLGKAHNQTLKGMGFYARIERDDGPWHEQLFTRLKELYPEEEHGVEGVAERLNLARRLERGGNTERAAKVYREIAEDALAPEELRADGADGLRRITEKLGKPLAEAAIAWNAATQRFKSAQQSGDTLAADLAMRNYALRFPFAPECGLSLCYRGGLRVDYACEESARPFYERGMREFAGDEQVRALGMQGWEFARRARRENVQIESRRDLETSLSAIGRQLSSDSSIDRKAGLKSFSTLAAANPDAIVRAPSTDEMPRFESLKGMTRQFVTTLSADERALFTEPLVRAAEARAKEALAAHDAVALESVDQRFPGTPAGAKALNAAGNMYLDQGQYARAAQAFRTLLREYRGSGAIDEALAAAKELRALHGLGAAHETTEAENAFLKENADAKVRFRGEEISGREVLRKIAANEKPEAAMAPATQRNVETFGFDVRRLGAPGNAPAPGALEWFRPLKRSECYERARNTWGDDPVYRHVEAYPVCADGRVFTSTREDVRAFSSDGKELWAKNWNNGGYAVFDRFAGFPLSLPTVKDGRLFVRSISPEKSSVLRCYTAEKGELVWDTEKDAALKKWIFSSEPLLAYRMIYATFFEPLDKDTSRCGMAALNAETGKLVWTRYFGTGNSGIYLGGREARQDLTLYRVTLQQGPPSAHEGSVYASTGLGGLAALGAYDGAIQWLSQYPRLRAGSLQNGNSGIEGFQPRLLKVLARGPSSPVVDDEIVAIAPKDAAGILGFDRHTGELRWNRELLDSRYVAGVCDGRLLIADDTTAALDLKTGKSMWEYAGAKRLVGQPGYCGNVLYLPEEDALVRLDARTGQVLGRSAWDAKTNGPLVNLIVTGERIYGVNNSVVGALKSNGR